jgi:hypothetical protein
MPAPTALILIAVGGGAFQVPDRLAGISEVIRVPHGDCANAVGAAAQISGETDQVYRDLSRATRSPLPKPRPSPSLKPTAFDVELAIPRHFPSLGIKSARDHRATIGANSGARNSSSRTTHARLCAIGARYSAGWFARQTIPSPRAGIRQQNVRGSFGWYPISGLDEATIAPTADHAFSVEQFHARTLPNNARRLSGKEWLCAATRA